MTWRMSRALCYDTMVWVGDMRYMASWLRLRYESYGLGSTYRYLLEFTEVM